MPDLIVSAVTDADPGTGRDASHSVPLAPDHGRLSNVQVMRACAALLVVSAHGAKELIESRAVTANTLWPFVLDRGQFGVDIFFVISGFVICHISRARLNEPGYAPDFLIRRIARIVPTYWFYLTLMVCVTLLVPQVRHQSGIDVWSIVTSYLFIPFRSPEPILGVGWTLNYEIYFYVVFFFAMSLFGANAIRATLVYFATVFVLGRVVAPHTLAFSFWSGSLVFEFSYGVLIALLFDAKLSLGRTATAALVVLGVMSWLAIGIDPARSLLPMSSYRGFNWGIPAAFIVAGLTLRARDEQGEQRSVSRFIAKLGDASYSLYLVHVFVMRIVTISLSHVSSRLGHAYAVTYFAMFFLASISAAFASYRLLERPAERLWRNRLRNLLHAGLLARPDACARHRHAN